LILAKIEKNKKKRAGGKKEEIKNQNNW